MGWVGFVSEYHGYFRVGYPCCVHRHLVLPLKLCPHGPELGFGARGRHDIVHDVNMDVVQHNHISVTGATAHVVDNVPEDYSILGRGDLDISLDVCKVIGSEHNWLWFFHQLEVAKCGQL